MRAALLDDLSTSEEACPSESYQTSEARWVRYSGRGPKDRRRRGKICGECCTHAGETRTQSGSRKATRSGFWEACLELREQLR